MATYRLVTGGKSQPVLYDVLKDGAAIAESIPYSQAIVMVIDLSRAGDVHEEQCDGNVYCRIPVERTWGSHAEHMKRFADYLPRRVAEADDWLRRKLEGQPASLTEPSMSAAPT